MSSTMDWYHVAIATTPLPCSITLVMTFQMFYIADLLIYYTIDIVGYPLAALLTVPVAVVGYYFAAMVLAIVIPLWIVYHTTLYTHSRVNRLIYPYGPYRHDRHNVILCGHVDTTKSMNKFKKILFLLLLLAYLPSTSAPSPSPSVSTNTTGAIVTTVATAVAMSPCMSLSSRGRKRTLSKKKRDMQEEEEEKKRKRDTQKEKKQRKTTANVDLSVPGAFAKSCCNNERCNDGCSNDSSGLKPRPYNKTSTYRETTKKKRDIQEEEEKKELKKAKRREQYAKKMKDPQMRKARNEKERKRYANMGDDNKEERKSQKRDYDKERYKNMDVDEKEARVSQISDNKSKKGEKKIGSALDQDINEVELFSLGDMDCKCYHCGALGYWCENKGSKTKPHFGALCCNQGKVTIPLARDFELDDYIKKLLTSNTDKEAIYFRKHSVSHFVFLLFILALLLI